MAGTADADDVFIVFDLETTGMKPQEGHEIIEIGAVPILDGRVREDCAFVSLVNPDRLIPEDARAVHGISDEMVREAPRIDVVLPEFLRYCGAHALVAQNAEFDVSFLRAACGRLELAPPPGPVHDTMLLSRQLYPGEKRHGLDDICRRLGLDIGRRHRSLDDVRLTAQAFLMLRERLAKRPGR
jgi:DNA polymerase III epsilon subunit